MPRRLAAYNCDVTKFAMKKEPTDRPCRKSGGLPPCPSKLFECSDSSPEITRGGTLISQLQARRGVSQPSFARHHLYRCYGIWMLKAAWENHAQTEMAGTTGSMSSDKFKNPCLLVSVADSAVLAPQDTWTTTMCLCVLMDAEFNLLPLVPRWPSSPTPKSTTSDVLCSCRRCICNVLITTSVLAFTSKARIDRPLHQPSKCSLHCRSILCSGSPRLRSSANS
jgi:hypothetical protein